MPVFNLAIVITVTLLHHPHDPRLDITLSNPHNKGGAALLIIHILSNHKTIFPEKDLPPPPMPPRPTSRPSPTRFLSDNPIRKSSISSTPDTNLTCRSEESLMGPPSASLSTPLPCAEF